MMLKTLNRVIFPIYDNFFFKTLWQSIKTICGNDDSLCIGLTPNGYFPLMYQPLFHFDKMSFFIIGICLIKYFTWIRDWIFSLQNIVTLTGPPGNIIVYRFYN